MSSNFKNAEDIVQNVRRADGGISFVKTLGSFIQNSEFSKGYTEFINGKNTAGAYVWKALSAIGSDINSVVYSNVLDYIDAVSNIDTCSVKSLKSMMNLVGSSYEIFGNLDMLPIEVLQLLDILSISKKYLLDSSKFKQSFIDDVKESGIWYDSAGDGTLRWKYQYIRNSFIISADNLPDCPYGIYGKYDLTEDYSYSYVESLSYLSSDESKRGIIPENVAKSFENYDSNLSGLICRKYESRTGWSIAKVTKYFDDSQKDFYDIIDRSGNIKYTLDSDIVENQIGEIPVHNMLSGLDCYVQSIPEYTELKTTYIDEEKYRLYIKELYQTLLSSIITMQYNTKLSSDGSGNNEGKVLPIYCYLRDEYYHTNAYYESIDNSVDSRRRFKNKNNIPLSFDEKAIVDAIDNGTDSLDNYFGAELDLLKLEISYRAKTLSFNGNEADDYLNNITGSAVEKYTRYSYYRKAKVLEYMRFIDNQYYNGSSYLKDASIYAFNPNFYEVEKAFNGENGNVVKKLDKYEGDIANEINMDVIETVAETLTSYTFYISKLREKVRLQTRKNYMKGTNNLIRYVVNEYLVDLARNGALFKDDDNNYLSAIRAQLSSHDIDNVQVVEYYDTTEYYNIQTNTTEAAKNSDLANDRYWENTIVQDADGKFFARDGIDINQNEIENFYLSTLCLKNQLSDPQSNTFAFLSTIFDLGATTSYIGKDGQFVTKLSSGEYSDEIYNKYLKLSSDYEQLKLYSDGYAFDTSHIAKQQLVDLVQNLISKISAEYFIDVSANYNKYMPEVESLLNELSSIDEQYNQSLQDYKDYLAKSNSKYAYENYDTTKQYKHDYYIDNPMYNATLLLDKLSQLRLFTLDINNIRMHSFLDGLEDISIKYSVQLAAMNAIREQMYAEGIQFNDINSQYINEELQCMESALESQKDSRVQQLQSIVQTSKGLAEKGYNTAINYLQGNAEEYDQLSKEYTNIIASYRNKYVDTFGAAEMKYMNAADKDDHHIDAEYITISISAMEEADTIKDKCKNAIVWMTQTINWPSKDDDEDEDTEDIDYEDYEEQPDNEEKSEGLKIRFGNQYNLPDSPYVLADPGIIEALKQLINKAQNLRTEVLEANESLKPLNNAISSMYSRLDSDSSYPGDIELDIDEALAEDDEGKQPATNVVYKILASQLEEQYAVACQQFDTIDDLFKNDKMFAICKQLLDQIQTVKSTYSAFENQYSAFLSDAEIAEYLTDFSNSGEFSLQTKQDMQIYSTTKDETARKGLLLRIDDMYNAYYATQSKYVKLMQNMKDNLPRYYFTNDYLESDLSSAISSLTDDVNYNTDLAEIKMNAKMAQLQKSIDSLSEGISSQLDLSGSSVLVLFENEIQKFNVLENPQYIAAKELFYQYAGLSSSHAPFFNYKNVTHATRQLHNFIWNFIEVDKYAQIASNSFDSVYVNDLETSLALSTVDEYIGKQGQLIDIWKHNVQDYTGYSTRYIDSPHTIQNYVGTFEVADYDGPFYPPAIDMLRASPEACISSLVQQYSILDNINAMLLDESIPEDLVSFTAQNFYSAVWRALKGNAYKKIVPNGNLDIVIHDFIAANSIQGYDYDGTATLWMTSTKTAFAKYIADNVNKSFFERFYYPLSLSKQNYAYIAQQLSCDEILDQILDITDSHLRKDVYDIYKYGLDTYGNMYTLYKRYGEDNPTYQKKKNTLGQIWIRFKDHPIAFPMVLSEENAEYSQIDLSTANEYIRQLAKDELQEWCYDFNFSDNKRLICITVKNKQEDLPEYFKGKFKYSQQAIALVSQKTNVDLNRAILKISNPDDVPDDIVTQPHLKKFELPEEKISSDENLPYAYQFLGSYSPNAYQIGLVYVKTNYNLDDDNDVVASLAYPPEIQILKATNETSNIELQDSLYIKWQDGQFILPNGEKSFNIDNDEAIFSYNFSTRLLTFAFLGSLMLEDGNKADQYKTPFDGNISISANTNGCTIDDPVASEMNSHDVFTDCIIVANAKPTADSLVSVGKLKLYNTNSDAAYLPLYPGKDCTAKIDELSSNNWYWSFELLGKSNNLTEWIRKANPWADLAIDLSTIMDEKVNGRIYEDYEHGKAQVSADLLESVMEQYSPLMNVFNGYNQSENAFTWEVDLGNSWLASNNDKLDDVKVILYNVDLHGKNPYYVCTLADLLQTRNQAYDLAMKPACYDELPQEYASNDVSSSIFNENSPCKAIASQAYYYEHGTDNNNLQGISSLAGSYDNESRTLSFRFAIDSNYEQTNEDGVPFIAKDQLRLLIFNTSYLKAFDRYHMLDIYGLIHIYKTDTPMFDIVGDDWHINLSRGRFKVAPYYFDANGVKHMLSDVNMEDYKNLDDIYVLSGTNHLHFKYNEEMIYDISSDMYYYPSINIKMPYSPATYINSLGFNESLKDGHFYSNVFDENNYYVFRLDDPKEIANKIGNVSIGIEGREPEVLLAFESYINSGDSSKYDYSDTRNFGHIQFTEATTDEPQEINYEIPEEAEEAILSMPDLLSALQSQTVEDLLDFQTTALCADYSLISSGKPPQLTFNANSDSVDLSEALKIHVSYQKEEDKSLTLYFNYMNFLDTPYVKIVKNKAIPDVIDGTYLKLAAGEEGILNLVVQFKYYSKQIVYGVCNVALVTYRILNLSDTKPKFLISRASTVTKNQYENIDINNKLILKTESKTIARNDLEAIDGEYYVNVEVRTEADGIPLSDQNSFTLVYNSAILDYVSTLTSGHTTDGLNPGTLNVQTLEAGTDVFVFKFRVKNADSMFKHSNTKADFNFSNVSYFFSNGELITNVDAINGSITFQKDN